MQIVISNNRVIAHGGEYIAMGGTVICEATGKAYQNATVAEVDCVPCDIDLVGYEYCAGTFVPCAPYGIEEDGYVMVVCKECATPKRSNILISEMLGVRLKVHAPEGSVLATTNGTRTAKFKWEDGVFKSNLPDYGVWNVSAMINGFTGTQSVNVDVVKEYSLTFGSTITVTYPAGVVCTCTKGNKTITAPDTSGKATFVVCGTGTFTLKIQNGDTVASNNVTINAEGENKTLSLNFFTARIAVNYPVGAVCTCSNGDETFTAPDTSGSHTFIVNSAGTWTITAATSDESKSTNVVILANGDNKSATIDFFSATITVKYPAGATCTLTDGTTTYTAPDTSGTATFTVKNTGNWTAKAENENTVVSKVVLITASGQSKSVTLDFEPTVSTSPKSGVTYANGLSNASWADISRFSKTIAKDSAISASASTVYVDYNNLHYKFSVGDRKTVTFSGKSAEVQIIGFKHTNVANSTSYGAAKAGMTFDFAQLSDNQSLEMSHASSQTGSNLWSSSRIRSTLNAKTFNSDLENVIVYASIPCVSDPTAGTITYLTDKIFILSEYEVMGSVSNYSPGAEGSQYAYNAAGNSKLKYCYDSNGNETVAEWWTRTPVPEEKLSMTGYNCCLQINETGKSQWVAVNGTRWVVPVFCV